MLGIVTVSKADMKPCGVLTSYFNSAADMLF